MPVSGSNYNEIQNSAKMQLNANDLIFNSTGNEGDVVWTTEGYTTINYIPDMEFAQTEKFVDLSTQLSVAVTNPNPRKQYSCNFSFNIKFNFNLMLPNINPDSPNLSLLYKINDFSKEVANINDILIRSIQDMNCCDMGNIYNKLVVPFFRWFADHPSIKNCSYSEEPTSGSCGPLLGGDTFPKILIEIAKVLLQVYIAVRPLACLLRPLPGNPWWPADFDPLKFVYGFLDFYDMYLDYIVSGRLVDEYLLNPVRKIRQQIQNCITGNGTIFNNNQEMQILLNTQARTYLNKQISLINEKILNCLWFSRKIVCDKF